MKLVITGIEDALGRLEKVRNVEKPVLEALGELMEEAREIVDARYASQGNGNTDYLLEIREEPNGFALVASGEDVAFLEFGAGFGTKRDVFADEMPFDVSPGSWSESHEHPEGARYFARDFYWYYNKEPVNSIDPTRGMQEALNHIRNNLEERITRKIEAWIDE